ncbi:MAG: AAA family ATPase [Actinomycetota bacterium]
MATAPDLIVVSGLPGAGKSTVGRVIADRIGATFLDKDDFLEALLDTDDAPRQVLSRRADEHFLDAVASAPTAVAVSFWRRSEVSATSGTPIDRFPADRHVIEVWCDCPVHTAHARFFARSRHSGHGDDRRNRAETLEQLQRLAELGPLRLGPLIRVDTNAPLDADWLVRQLDIALPPGSAHRE